MDNIVQKLKKILKDIVNDECLQKDIETADNLDFIRDLKFDSVDIMKFVLAIEEVFEVEVMKESNFIDIIKDLRSVEDWLKRKEKGT